ncbi:MAG: carbohydrate binding family 9 domain-containing protein, partial [Candidatus Aminicenantes bacterium]|nr:carbohydrate binding family 9 domain-containing protein [Candidatus Aminicenantes bacterium]
MVAGAGALSAQTPPSEITDILKLPRTERIVIPRLSGPVTLDGRSDEPAWSGVRPFCMVMQSPTFGEPASERSEALVAYDDDFVYVAARMFDREPDRIQAPTKKRDAMVATTDWFGVLFDTFNDKENALAFFTTPAGLRFDAAIFRDAQPTMAMEPPMNLSWNTFWDVAVVRGENGWHVEMRIPLSSLRFQTQAGAAVMGVTVFRWISRKNEVDVFPAIPRDWGDMSAWKPSQCQETLWPGLKPRRPLYITPYVLGGLEEFYELNDEETEYVEGGTPEFEMGIDVKYGLSGNLTLDATVNPDFAQVEADDVQVNLTRFSVFFPEKRLFFQERSSNFDFPMGGSNTLFYSRRIGLVDDRPVRIYGGGRLVGRLGGWDVGFLDMQTAALDENPSENFGVLRLRRQLINPFSYVGGMLTSRLGAGGSYNLAYGLDWIWRVRGDDYFTLQWAQTFENGASNRAFSLDSSRFALMWERRTTRGFGTTVRFSRVGPEFDPGMGFMMFENYTAFYTRTLYGWFPGKGSALSNHDGFVEARIYWDNDTRQVTLAEIGPGWEFAAKSGFGGRIWPKINVEELDEPYELTDDILVPVGRYVFPGMEFFLQTPPGRLFNTILTGTVGGYYDGWRISLGAMPTWSGIPDLEVSGLLQYNLVRFRGRDQTYVAPIGQVKVLATLSVKFSASALVQYSGADDAVSANVRFRYNPREGTDLYLVYNEGLNTDRLSRTPVPPLSSGRALYAKFSYTFN